MKYLKLMRIKHYIKNFLIFVPGVFSMNLFHMNDSVEMVKGFIIFSFVSSIVYIINDINDREADKNHPQKKYRPLPSGLISIKESFELLVGLFIGVLILCFLLSRKLSILYIGIYFFLNLLYSINLKKEPIVDVFVIAIGFIIRVLFGSALIGVRTSSWLYLTVVSFAFFFAFGKRRNELKDIKENIYSDSRTVLNLYSYEFLNMNMYMCLTMGLIFYSLWASYLDNPYIIYSVILVLFIAFKYNLDNDQANLTGDPIETLLKDKSLICASIIYVIYIVSVLYYF